MSRPRTVSRSFPPRGKLATVSSSGPIETMEFDDQILKDFLEPQIRDFGANLALDDGLWTLFAVPANDALANAIARSVLGTARFAYETGTSADDQWTLHYVDTTNRPLALHWLDDLTKLLAGSIRPASPAHRALIDELSTSDKPHRIAQQFGELHTKGEVCAGLICEARTVRSLLDRLHQREPLFFSAFLTLLNHHLIDLVVLLRQLIAEDVSLKNEIVLGALSRDPFLQSRQDAAAEIRNILIRYRIINPLDQQKNTAISNPYAVFLEMVVTGEEISVPIDGNAVTVPRQDFLHAVHQIRRNLYRGEEFSSFDTQAPWMNAKIAYPFRFIKQRVGARRELAPLDTLYMLERAAVA